MATIKLPNGKRLKLMTWTRERYSAASDALWQKTFTRLQAELLREKPHLKDQIRCALISAEWNVKGECEL
jgi:hypothetical protein